MCTYKQAPLFRGMMSFQMQQPAILWQKNLVARIAQQQYGQQKEKTFSEGVGVCGEYECKH